MNENILTPLSTSLSRYAEYQNEATQKLVSDIGKVSIQLAEIEEKYHVDLKKNRSRFDLLSRLTRHHLEELHSNFLHYLLSPSETHDCDELFLKEFCYCIHENDPTNLSHEYIQTIDFSKAQVFREHFCGSINNNRTFIDVYIELPDLIIAIENKINAGEQPDQIYRYAQYCKQKNKPYIVLYLTKYGELSNTHINEKYTPISYNNEIRLWLEKCKEKTADYPSVCNGINNYLTLINQKILNQPPNTITMKLKELLLEPANIHILKHAKELNTALTEIKNGTRNDFFAKLYQQLELLNLNFRPVSKILDKIDRNAIWSNHSRGFTCFDDELCLEITPGVSLHFCIEHDSCDLWYGLFAVITDSKTGTKTGADCNFFPETSQIRYALSAKLKDIVSDDWWCCTRYLVFGKSSFDSDELTHQLAIDSDAVLLPFIEGINEYIHVWREVITDYKKQNSTPE